MMVDEDTGDDMEAFEVSLSWRNSADRFEEYAENVQIEDESNYIINFFGETSKVLTDEEIEKLGLFER